MAALPSSGLRRIALLVVLALFASTALLLSPASPAAADPNSSISGLVTGPGGTPVEGVRVWSSSDIGWGETTTGVDGSYLIEGLEPGDYTVRFEPQGNLVDQYYDGSLYQDGATLVVVGDDELVPGIDASLEVGGTITGAVTDTGGNPVDVRVVAYGDQTGINHDVTAFGTYTLEGLPDDEYRLEFHPTDPSLVKEFYEDTFDFWAATLVPASSGGTTSGIDVELASGGTISGNVTDPGGLPFDQAYVRATEATAGLVAVGTYTDGDGNYTVPGLPAGDYIVSLQPPDGFPLVVAEYYDATPYEGSATPVAVQVGMDTPDIDASLDEGGTISGTVTDADTNPVEGATVTATSNVGEWSTTTDGDGGYTFPALQIGDYTVAFTGPDDSGLQAQWWEGVAEPGDATPVVVTAGATTPNIDAELVPVPPSTTGISGTVTGPGGVPLEDVRVSADADPGGSDTFTEADGTYEILGIDPGDYAVQFVPEGNLVAEYYDGVHNYWEHTPVTVEADAITGGIDAELEAGGTITGTVTDDLGDPIEAEIIVYGAGTGFFKIVNGDGAYTVEGLPDDDYVVEFRAIDNPTLVREYFDDVLNDVDATPVTVTAGNTATDIDASLSAGGTISGTVTDALGDPYEDSEVVATSTTDPGLSVNAFTDGDGNYTITGLPVDSYTVHLRPPGDTPFVVAEYYDNAAYVGDATPVVVTAGDDTPDIDASLQAGGTISGTVTDTDTNPVEEATVTATSDAGDWSTTTDGDGGYTFPALQPGDYTVAFAGPDGSSLIPQWWEGVADPGDATPVTVVAGADTPGIDAALASPPPTGISGTVTDTGGNPQAGTRVTASGPDSWGEAFTDGDGNYTITDLQPGDHIVQFVPEGNLVDEYYDGARYEEDATPVGVSAGITTPGIDAELETGGTITGTVTDALGDPVEVEVAAYGDQTGLNHTVTAFGSYALEGLPDDDYRIEFRPTDDPNLVIEFYDDVTYYWDADLVSAESGQVTSGIDAQLETGGTMSGTITDAGGDPYVEAYVTATNVADPLIAISAYTDADGDYAINGLPAGDYLVYLEPPDGHPYVVPEFFDGAAFIGDADLVLVTAGANTPDIDASLADGGAISGTVTDSESNPIEGATIVAASDAGEWSTTTDGDGGYTLEGLQLDDYTVSFSGPEDSGLQMQYWQGVIDPDEATPVTVLVEETTAGIDAVMVPAPTGGSVSGTVTSEATGLPISGVEISVWSADDGDYFDTVTDEDGFYEVTGLPDSETYWVLFLPDFETDYLYEYYDGALSLFDATYVVVEDGAAVTDIDASLQQFGTISGRVTEEATGLPLEDVLVTASDPCMCDFFAITDADGNYTIEDVEPGTYAVSFEALDPDLAVEFYDGVFDPDDATPVVVASDGTVTDIDASLRSTKANLSGTVTDTISGDPIAGASVTIYDGTTGNVVRTTTTGVDGTYLLNKFQAGDYKVRFNGQPDHGFWWAGGGGQSRATAAPIPLSPGPNTLDATLTSNIKPTLAGTVTDSVSGDPIEGASVTIYDGTTGNVVRSTTTGADGTYLLNKFTAGDYKVRVSGQPDHTYWWAGGGGQSRTTATPIPLNPGPNTLDATLAPTTRATLSGTVTDSVSGDPLEGVSVTLYDAATGNVARSTTTGADGTYLLNKFTAGYYKVRFNGQPDHGLWWAGGGGQSRHTAALFAISSGPNTLDATLAPLG